jgi:hypothetical protein
VTTIPRSSLPATQVRHCYYLQAIASTPCACGAEAGEPCRRLAPAASAVDRMQVPAWSRDALHICRLRAWVRLQATPCNQGW